MKRATTWAMIGIFSFFGLYGCKKKEEVPPPAPRADVRVISAFTSGVISRESPIRVIFAEEIVESSAVGAPLEKSPFIFEPDIPGVAVWSSGRELEFRPRERLAGGRSYKVEIDLEKLLGHPLEEKRLLFQFSAMPQDFDVAIEGLEAETAGELAHQRLRGVLSTVDADYPSEVEKVLRASQGERQLPIGWSHSPDRRRHEFVVTGIIRQETESEVQLSWNGGPLGVEKQGSQAVKVPGLNNFVLLGAQAVSVGERYIVLRFSDPLPAKQNLAGLIRVGQKKLRFEVEGNLVRIFSSRPWGATEKVQVSAGLKNSQGFALQEAATLEVAFEMEKPAVRFVGRGVILPTSQGLQVPIEAVNLRAVVVEAIQVYEKNLPQFLQVNSLDGDRELRRVGRLVWRKTIPLGSGTSPSNTWTRYGLDLSPLVKAHPDGLYRLQLSFRRPHILYNCPGSENGDGTTENELEEADWDEEEKQKSLWDGAESWVSEGGSEPGYYYGEGEGAYGCYESYQDPCHRCYYLPYGDHNITISRNVLVSDIGLIVKRGNDGSLLVLASDLRSAQPLVGAEIDVLDFQQQLLAEGKTDSQGLLRLTTERRPFLVMARQGRQLGVVKLEDGAALSVSHFDAGGEAVAKGLKGFLYGERGVWRPGDTMYLTFILLDTQGRIPDRYPVKFELRNPRGQLVTTSNRTESLDGFYTFEVATAPDAPTGDWSARVLAGGAVFERSLKVETVVPNRLKIALDFGRPMIGAPDFEVKGKLSARWLHGAIARNLKADVEVTLQATTTRFAKFAEYIFDAPVPLLEVQGRTLFEGELDEKGEAAVSGVLKFERQAPGMMQAHFRTRVFEPSGAFSVDRFAVPYSPYQRYIGLRLPKGDKARGMLLTDVKHEAKIVAVDPAGELVKSEMEVEASLYKVEWRWWWDKSMDASLAKYLSTSVHQPLLKETVKLVNGEGVFRFEVKYPDWGRYLVVVHDPKGGHRTGKTVYIDWPGWAGRAQKDSPGGANLLTFTADNSEVSVGEKVVLSIPTPKQGRLLVSLETGSRVLQAAWLDATGEETRYEFTATAEMTPNLYAHVSLVQPHLQTANDLPIRLYGILPIRVTDPQTLLKPQIDCPEVLPPEQRIRIGVQEASGRPMTYTLALVDEGLLTLTRFDTPDPWNHFYAREALGVKTWDVYDQVAGAWSGSLERLLAIGGGDEAEAGGERSANRFPPMVKFLGPFRLAAGAKNQHDIDMPSYLGAVRVMVVAGRAGAFGRAEKSVPVRKPLMLLATLPRVLGPEEELELPVAVFALEEKIKKVELKLAVSGPLEIAGEARRTLSFSGPGDQMTGFALKVKPALGLAVVNLQASGGGESASQRVEIDVRSPAQRSVDVLAASLEPGKTWETSLAYAGMPGTNEVTLELSRVPPFGLSKRLEFLIAYPHGCVEQTTSSVFPQLYLSQLLDLSGAQKERISKNIQAGIERLRTFQNPAGGFGYWPGDARADDWSSSYAGHFLLEAQKAGYLVPAAVINAWKNYQRNQARAWAASGANTDLVQAYRLYTLALAGEPDLGSMNRIKESGELQTAARFALAGAYHYAGQGQTALDLTNHGRPMTFAAYRELANTYGSDLRDKALVLEILWLLRQGDKALPLAIEIAKSLDGQGWYSTQTTAFALMALAHFAAGGEQRRTQAGYRFGGESERLETSMPLIRRQLEFTGEPPASFWLENIGDLPLFARLLVAGTPKPGRESDASNGLGLEVSYTDPQGGPVEEEALEQGQDFFAVVQVKNLGRQDLRQLALTQIFASGWEIINQRLEGSEGAGESPFDYRDVRDDRVYTYFDLKPGETKTFRIGLNASYLGSFYLGTTQVEAMYDASINARVRGKWVKVERPSS